ncbi:hypothetical protein K7W03_06130 [Sphingobium sp. PNB]|uniref:hypothetical protein n=1 Tax=Sphingobium sp. PNB TaxID=863934 RepID=UPI001CA4109F|nr:hypothetical protein [Sphingobium sp. PNB]MCB4859176.1 hypothetical protein [Sphingobium sp. PNB]
MSNISVSGRAQDGDPDTYWCNLFEADKVWNGNDQDHASNIMKTKAGKWLFKAVPDKGVYAMDAAGKVVLFFRNLDPATARVGDQGNGHAYETARNISWKVDSL